MGPPTPHYLFRPGVAAATAARLSAAFSDQVEVLYAAKVNPDPRILAELSAAGFGVEVASPAELDAATAAGFDPAEALSTNTVRPVAASVHALTHSVRHFVVDSPGELARLATAADQVGVDPTQLRLLVRIAVDQDGARYPLGEKFGVAPGDLDDLAHAAAVFGPVAGVAFHAGDQVTDPRGFHAAASRAAAALDHLAGTGRLADEPWVDLGGGWPGHYDHTVPAIEECASAAVDGLGPWWDRCARRLAEPGRYVATWCYQLVASVVGVAARATGQWAHLDAGVYNSVIDPALAPSIALPVRVRDTEDRDGPVLWTLAGPTCDAVDVLARGVALPEDLHDGDVVLFDAAGAYSLACASAFNGFAPARVAGELDDELARRLAPT